MPDHSIRIDCDHCQKPIESAADLQVGIKPFKYHHFHKSCLAQAAEAEGKQPLILKPEAIRSLAISTTIPGLILLFMPVLAMLFDGFFAGLTGNGEISLNRLVQLYSELAIMPILGGITLLLSFFHWRELGLLK